MGDETRQQLKIVQEELAKIKKTDEQQSEELSKVQRNGSLKLILNFFDRTKWFWLVTGVLIFLLVAGYGPAEIVQWVKEVAGSIGIGN